MWETVKNITKYSTIIMDPKTIKYELEKATYIALSGRPGPVWIEIPQDIQWADINPDELESFTIPDLSKFEKIYAFYS